MDISLDVIDSTYNFLYENTYMFDYRLYKLNIKQGHYWMFNMRDILHDFHKLYADLYSLLTKETITLNDIHYLEHYSQENVTIAQVINICGMMDHIRYHIGEIQAYLYEVYPDDINIDEEYYKKIGMFNPATPESLEQFNQMFNFFVEKTFDLEQKLVQINIQEAHYWTFHLREAIRELHLLLMLLVDFLCVLEIPQKVIDELGVIAEKILWCHRPHAAYHMDQIKKGLVKMFPKHYKDLEDDEDSDAENTNAAEDSDE